MTIVAVVRPGWTDFDEQHRLIGSLDLPLNSRGESQLATLIERLKVLPKPPDGIVCGTAQPAKRTAEFLGQELDVTVRESDELANLNLGLWQSSTIEDVGRRMSRIFRQWQEAPETVCPSEGEPWDVAVARVQRALKKPLRKFDVLLIVASEPLASLVSSLLTGEPPDLTKAFSEQRHDPIIEFFESSRDGEFVRRSNVAEDF